MKRIFIVTRHALFAHGIEGLLGQVAGLQVVGRSEDPVEALARIRELQPDVAILGGDECDTELAPLVLHLLRQGACGRVIAVSMETNTLCVYCGCRQVMASAADLIEAIGYDAPAA